MKNDSDLIYYYSVNGATYGPYALDQLLEKINSDTLVYREGIEWTNANEIDELKKFFNLPNVEKKSKNDLINKDFSYQESDQDNVVAEPQNMFSAPFSFEGRIRRAEYVYSFIIYVVSYAIIISIVKSSSAFGIAYIPLFWFLWAQGAKRCHDRSSSGWYQLIPFYIFWMLFAEGDNVENEYGNQPKN
jgi:uncharacterized membrane protein YhaH (DUF805 family)